MEDKDAELMQLLRCIVDDAQYLMEYPPKVGDASYVCEWAAKRIEEKATKVRRLIEDRQGN